jgi:uncharacterized protein YlxW (UPF0749 family)
MTPEERWASIEEKHQNLAQHVDTLTKSLVRLEEMGERTDKRINRLFSITLKIGADFAQRIQALEEGGE